jgi:hypothetical protein
LNGEYWWRVEAESATETVWSGMWHFNAATILQPQFTDLAINQTIDPVNGPWTAIPSTSMYDYEMILDPAVPYYYLDLDVTTATNMELQVGWHPFYLTDYPDGYLAYWSNNGVYAGCTGPWEAIFNTWEMETIICKMDFCIKSDS